MKLILCGDSFPAGQIKDPSIPKEEYETISFGFHLFNCIGEFKEYHNVSRPGAGNESILHQIYKYIRDNDATDCFFLISWSGITRNCLYDKNQDEYRNAAGFDPRLGITQEQRIDFQFRMDHLILSAIKLLETYNLNYIMTSSFNNILLEGGMITKEFVKNNRINWISPERPNNSLFDIITYEWHNNKHVDSMTNHTEYQDNRNALLADCLHPSRLGHKKIAKIIFPEIIDKL